MCVEYLWLVTDDLCYIILSRLNRCRWSVWLPEMVITWLLVIGDCWQWTSFLSLPEVLHPTGDGHIIMDIYARMLMSGHFLNARNLKRESWQTTVVIVLHNCSGIAWCEVVSVLNTMHLILCLDSWSCFIMLLEWEVCSKICQVISCSDWLGVGTEKVIHIFLFNYTYPSMLVNIIGDRKGLVSA